MASNYFLLHASTKDVPINNNSNTFLLLTRVPSTIQSPFHTLAHKCLPTTYETGTITTPILQTSQLRTLPWPRLQDDAGKWVPESTLLSHLYFLSKNMRLLPSTYGILFTYKLYTHLPPFWHIMHISEHIKNYNKKNDRKHRDNY